MKHGQRTVLGFDFGTRCIGVAVGQEITGNTQPLITLQANDGEPQWQEIGKLIDTWRADALVVGIPLDLDGSRQEMTERAEHFAQELANRFSLTVYHSDERLTSMEARNHLPTKTKAKQRRDDWQRKAILDQVAAQLILETWLSEPHLAKQITYQAESSNGA